MTRSPVEGDAPGETAAAAEEAVAPQSDAERIRDLEVEVAELSEAHARAAADLQNYRRRSEERWADRARAIVADAAGRYLLLLDDLDRALGSVDEDIADHQWVEGIRLVRHKFQETLAASGIEQVATDEAVFDPLVHEAISYGPGPEGRVIATVRAGYTIEDYVVRPAQVVVGDGTAPDGEGTD